MDAIGTTMDRFRTAITAASTAGAELKAHEEALLDGEAAALERILADLRPVMPHIDRAVAASGSCSGKGGWSYTYMDDRGIVLAGEREREEGHNDIRGTFTGEDLVYSRTGKLYHRAFDGSWSRFDDESSGWYTGGTDEDGDSAPGSSKVIGPRAALKRYDLGTVVEGIVGALEQAVKRQEGRKPLLAGRLERLRAVEAALGR